MDLLLGKVRPSHDLLQLAPELRRHLVAMSLTRDEHVPAVLQQPDDAHHRRRRPLTLGLHVQAVVCAIGAPQLRKGVSQAMREAAMIDDGPVLDHLQQVCHLAAEVRGVLHTQQRVVEAPAGPCPPADVARELVREQLEVDDVLLGRLLPVELTDELGRIREDLDDTLWRPGHAGGKGVRTQGQCISKRRRPQRASQNRRCIQASLAQEVQAAEGDAVRRDVRCGL
mmetsp:Transcript_47924/g.139682  ORF Transcript_47924/g.139682 Transcript_47924/m.139682 type:complete len:226 (-) Transcript_47924:1922-2599(-)